MSVFDLATKHCFSDRPPGTSLHGYGGPSLWLAMPVFDQATKHCFSDRPPGSSLRGYGGPSLRLATTARWRWSSFSTPCWTSTLIRLIVLRLANKMLLFFWSSIRFQSVWICGAFAVISCHCVWPNNKALLSSARFQSVWIQGTKHCYHLPGSSLCGYREQSIVIVCQVPVCVDTGNKALLLSARFQSVWIQGTKHCYRLPGSSLCGYREQSIVIVCQVPVCVDTGNKALLSSARFQSVWIQGAKHCYCLPGSSLCGYREQSIVIVCQVPVCVDMGSLCSDWQLTVLTWQQSVIVFWSFTKVPVFVDVRSVCPHLPFWQ